MNDNGKERWNWILRSIASSLERVKEIEEDILFFKKKRGYHRHAYALEQLLKRAKEQL